ncbi:MAG TPA: glucuronate isomerase, partial [Bacteroidota bacterium]|nr:glucuronate isomerase [Bacteroidota bacterium]
RLSDHGHETVYAAEYTAKDASSAFRTLMRGEAPGEEGALAFRSALAAELAVMDWEKGWVQMFHLGALRGTNTRMGRLLGSDAGFDSIGDAALSRPLARFLDRLDEHDRLAKTILFNLNPRDNDLVAAMIGNFQSGPVAGKMQFGPAWWFLDQIDGMTRQIEALSAMGLLSQFVGMLTDSRSILSFPRHEYFRRLLCNILGTDMRRGLIPDDIDLVGGMVRDISYHNARRYFAFPSMRGKRPAASHTGTP